MRGCLCMRINSDHLCMWKGDCLCMWKGDCLCTWKGNCLCMLIAWGGGLMIDAERINSQLSHGKFKRFNLFLLHVGIKTVYITVYNWCREDQQSLHVKRWLPLHVKRGSPLHVKRWSPLHMKRQLPLHMKRQLPLYVKRWLPLLILGIDDWCREDQQSTFTWKIQKI